MAIYILNDLIFIGDVDSVDRKHQNSNSVREFHRFINSGLLNMVLC